MEVSVPLRGYGFEIIVSALVKKEFPKFPSPYGDMVLKSKKI